MSASTSESPVAGNRAKAKSTLGWMAFDLKQRRKQQGLESDNDCEAYPSLSGPTVPQNKNQTLLREPFSSVVVASTDFPSIIETKNRNLQRPGPVSNSCLGTAVNIGSEATAEAYRKLNHLHPWADESLIQDVLAGVNNNTEEALSLLEGMLISENKDAKNMEVKSNGMILNPFTSKASPALLLHAAKSLPVAPEPDWEEDDVYLIHRKDAIRLIRSASRHSKAANDAYMRGDHISAHSFSVKAQEEWSAAKKLNAKAAKEILTVRNSKNDLWTLDLHGLHAGEAVEALRERLRTVESEASSNCLATLNGSHKESGLLLAEPMLSTTYVKMEKFGRLQPSSRLRPKLLQVITGMSYPEKRILWKETSL
ncbi:hypothetical protein Sango_1897100 [Sesamum angolense]|uniref:Smr domain-containing protein n=1 Tax=Sesamum angolense TaxID=2727404 RepID=A0AAE2BQV7_9LAMI|nr:hypothetical protein Sango_1897100 [Sesamum angolense]